MTDGARAAGVPRPLVVVLGFAALLRISYCFDYATLPFLHAPLFDSVVYLRQAKAVLAGDFGHPTLIAFSPLYGYFLALVGQAVAPFVQLALGLVNAWLVFRMTARRFGVVASAVASALFLTYGQFVFLESKIMADTLGATLVLLALTAFQSTAFAQGRWSAVLGAGLLLGLAIHARSTVLFAAPFFVLLALPSRCAAPGTPAQEAPTATRAAWRLAARRALGLAGGAAATLAAVGAWNLTHTGHFVPVIMRQVSPSTTWDGTLDRFRGDGGRMVDVWDFVGNVEAQLKRPPAEGAALGVDLARVDVGGILGAAPSKLARVFSNVETTWEYGYYGERTEVAALRVAIASFGAILALALLGAILLVRERRARELGLFMPPILGVIALGVVEYSMSRYRIPMVLALLPLAGHGAVAAARLAGRAGRAVRWATATICLLLVYEGAAYELRSPGMWHLRVAEAEAKRGAVTLARRRVALARRLEPGNREIHERSLWIERDLIGPD